MKDELRSKTIAGFLWRLLQNISGQALAFVVQIVLARILLPSDYSIIALTSVFVAIANVFVQTGFSSAVVQRKTLSDTDISSVFYVGIAASLLLYALLYLLAPLVARYYEMPLLQQVFRVQALTLVIASLYSVQQALVIRRMEFKKSLLATLVGYVLQGVVGVTMALKGFGTWALIAGSLVSGAANCVVFWLAVRWRPQPLFSLHAVKSLFSFSSRILLTNLINTVYNNVRALVIGKAYDPSTLSYYNRGEQMPQLIMVNVDGAMTTVLFSSLSSVQDDRDTFMRLLRRSMRLSLFVCAPLMTGLAAVAKPLVTVLLTEKWLPAVPFLQISCFVCLLWPLSAKLHALNAVGKSRPAMWLQLLNKGMGLLFLWLALRYNVYVFVASAIISGVLTELVSLFVYKRLLGYLVAEQLRDALPALVLAFIMGAAVYALGRLPLKPIWLLLLGVAVGACLYIGLAALFRLDSLGYLITLLKRRFGRTDEEALQEGKREDDEN